MQLVCGVKMWRALHGVTMASLQELWISVESVPGVHGNTVCTDWMHLQLYHEDRRQTDNGVLLIVGPQPLRLSLNTLEQELIRCDSERELLRSAPGSYPNSLK